MGIFHQVKNLFTGHADNNKHSVNGSALSQATAGYRFVATKQLRTPLRVLLRHGEIHADKNTEPPKITEKEWEGEWVQTSNAYLNIRNSSAGSATSNLSQHLPDDNEYIEFLITIRRVVETHEPIMHRISKLREISIEGNWESFIKIHGRIEAIIVRFFSRFVDTIPELDIEIIDELSRLGLDTPNHIAVAPDGIILGIKGVGLPQLNLIRTYCAAISDNRDANIVEKIVR